MLGAFGIFHSRLLSRCRVHAYLSFEVRLWHEPHCVYPSTAWPETGTEDTDLRAQKLGAIAAVDAFLTQLRNLDQAAVALRSIRLE